MVELARLPKGEWEGIGSIAKKIKAPKNYLGKVLQSLVSEGLVTSRRGLNGGFRLGRYPGNISLFDIVDPIENVGRWEGCFMKQGSCSTKKACTIHERWSKTRAVYIDFLKKTKLKDLII